jgi:hypothetical protein
MTRPGTGHGVPFSCSFCGEVFHPAWLDRITPGVCRSCASGGREECRFPDHPDHASPCGRPVEEPGTPCRYCGKPVPEDGTPCRDCWLSLTDVPLADIKAVFAADGSFHALPKVD